MPEHLIQLRKAWDATYVASGVETTRRLDLPTTWSVGCALPARLTRRFQAPRIEPETERLSLRLTAVEGVTAIRLDDEVLAHLGLGQTMTEITLDLSGGTGHGLALELDPGRLPIQVEEWGRIALVILM